MSVINTTFAEKFENNILSTWEEVYKKGQLTFWLLLAVKASARHMADIRGFIQEATNGTLTADDQSLYRALRRLHSMQLINFQEEPSDQGGPDRKVYALSETGQRVLGQFIERNITGIFYKPEIKQLLEEGEK